MTPAAKIVYSCAVVLGLLVGEIFGFTGTLSTQRALDDSECITAPGELDDFAYAQFRYADSQHARAALAAVVTFLESEEAFHPDGTQKCILATAYTRLALLDDADNNPAESQAHITEAQRWYAASGGQSHTDSEMKSAVLVSDERRPRGLITPTF